MPEFFTVLLIIIAVIAAVVLLAAALAGTVLSLRGVLTVAYNGELSVDYKILFFKLPIYPLRKKKEKRRRRHYMSAREAARIRKAMQKKEERKKKFLSYFKGQKKDEEKESTSKKTSAPQSKMALSEALTDTVDIVAALTEIIAVIVKRFTHHLKIKVARFKIKIASEDASVTAVTYGAVSQIINVLLPILATVKNFDLPKHKDFDISADFTKTAPEIDVKVSFSLRVWHFADMGIRSLWGGGSKLFSRRKNAKYPIPFIHKSIGEIIEGFSKSNDTENEKSEDKKENN